MNNKKNILAISLFLIVFSPFITNEPRATAQAENKAPKPSPTPLPDPSIPNMGEILDKAVDSIKTIVKSQPKKREVDYKFLYLQNKKLLEKLQLQIQNERNSDSVFIEADTVQKAVPIYFDRYIIRTIRPFRRDKVDTLTFLSKTTQNNEK